jgi:hypothetical protein
MAIKRMISRTLEEFREFQTRTVEVGRIRTGQFVVPEGRKGRPVKLDRFRLTSLREEPIRAAAEQYGGEARPYRPQGGGAEQWEVITELGSLEVLIINGQFIDPVYEMWGAGRTCVRRCDGEWNAQTREPCLCNGPNRPKDDRQLCKVTTRVQVMLPSVAGLHAWRLETHSENAAREMMAPTVGGLVRIAQVPVPATLYLRHEQRRERNHDKSAFESKDFYVPTFHIRLTALEMAAGQEAITAALVADGAPAALAPPEVRRELEAATPPVSAVPAPAADRPRPVPAGGAGGAPFDTDPLNEGRPLERGELPRILKAVEGADTLEALEGLKNAFAEQNVRHKSVFDAWLSKRAAVQARDEAKQLADDADAMYAEQQAEQLAEAYADQEPYDDSEPYHTEAEYVVGDTVIVGGIEFTRISDNPFPPGSEAAAVFVGEPGDLIEASFQLPMVPDVPYDKGGQWATVATLAGQRTPPLTTAQAKRLVTDAFGLAKFSDATGLQLARMAEAMRRGML